MTAPSVEDLHSPGLTQASRWHTKAETAYAGMPSHKRRPLCRIWHSCSDRSSQVYVSKDRWSQVMLGDLIGKMKKMSPTLDAAFSFSWVGEIINMMEYCSFAVIVFIVQGLQSKIREHQSHSRYFIDCLSHSAFDRCLIFLLNVVKNLVWFRHTGTDAGRFIIAEGDKTTLNWI